MSSYPTITLWQPWASFIAWGWKRIETRGHSRFGWLAGHRIAIHAGKRYDEDAWRTAKQWLMPQHPWTRWEDDARRDCGKIVCLASVSAFRKLQSAGMWTWTTLRYSKHTLETDDAN